MGVIVREEYICDFCGKAIGDGDALVGRLSLRKAGARGLGRNLNVALHADCSAKLTRYAAPVSSPRKVKQTA
jgi:ribosomal protein L24E